MHDSEPTTNAAGAEPVLLEQRDGAVVRLILNRRRAMNALDDALLAALSERLTALAADAEIGALILTGSGHRAFCFGADLRALDGDTAEARRARFEELLPIFQGVIRRLAGFPVPVIAALNGFATGAGFDLALACDLRLATPRVKLGSAFVGLGLVPDGGGTWHLPQLIGTARALELVLTADAVTADQALAMGLVNRIVEPDELETTATELATKLAAQPRTAVAHARRLVREAAGHSLDGALAAEARAQLLCATGEEFERSLERLRRRR